MKNNNELNIELCKTIEHKSSFLREDVSSCEQELKKIIEEITSGNMSRTSDSISHLTRKLSEVQSAVSSINTMKECSEICSYYNEK